MFVSFLKFNTEKVTCLRKLIANCYGVLSPCLLNRVNVMWLFTIWSNYLKANIIWNLCPVIGYQSLQWLFSFSWKTTSAVVRALPPPKMASRAAKWPPVGMKYRIWIKLTHCWTICSFVCFFWLGSIIKSVRWKRLQCQGLLGRRRLKSGAWSLMVEYIR